MAQTWNCLLPNIKKIVVLDSSVCHFLVNLETTRSLTVSAQDWTPLWYELEPKWGQRKIDVAFVVE